MGASAREIERQIKETRERMDENMAELEDRAAGGVRRYGKIVAIAAGVAAAAAVGLVVWRKMRRPTMRERLQAVRHSVTGWKRPLPRVAVVVGETDEPGAFESVARKVVPAVVGTAATGLVERLARPPDAEPE